MRLRSVIACALAALGARGAGQVPAPSPATRLGVFFWHDSPNDLATFAGIREGLAGAGLAVEFVERHADSDARRAARMLGELRAAGCSLVFAMGTQAALLARDHLRDVPVVFAAVGNPVASGLVPTWGTTHGNLCGASNFVAPETVLSVFRLAVPDLRRLGVLHAGDAVVSKAEIATLRAFVAEAGRPPLEVLDAVAPHADQIEPAVRQLLGQGVDAIWVPIDITIYQNLATVRRAIGDRKVPLVTTATAAMRGGAIVGAVPDYPLHGRRAAALAVRILRDGKRPHELAVDRMSGCLVVADLDAARALGIELPLSLLALADELIAAESPR